MVTFTVREGIIIKYEIIGRTTAANEIKIIEPNMGLDNLQASYSSQPRHLKNTTHFSIRNLKMAWV